MSHGAKEIAINAQGPPKVRILIKDSPYTMKDCTSGWGIKWMWTSPSTESSLWLELWMSSQPEALNLIEGSPRLAAMPRHWADICIYPLRERYLHQRPKIIPIKKYIVKCPAHSQDNQVHRLSKSQKQLAATDNTKTDL